MRDTALLGARLVLGGYLAAHGAQKLFGKFGGYGLDGTGGLFDADRPEPWTGHGAPQPGSRR